MLPGWLWCVLAPLILVVGAAGVVAFSIGVFAGTDAVLDTLFGEKLRARDERRALRRERNALDRGHWTPLVRLWQGTQPLAARWAPAVRFVRDGEVRRKTKSVWQVGALPDGTPLHFVHRSDVAGLDGRAFQIGDGALMPVTSFICTWGAEALRAAMQPPKEAGYREPVSVQASFEAAALRLGPSAVPEPPAAASSDLETLVAFAAPHLELKALPAASRPTLRETFTGFAERAQWWKHRGGDELGEPLPPLSDFARFFPEHASAAGWVALTDPEPPASDLDEEAPPEPLTLYVAEPDGLRIVALAFSEDAPWVVSDHRDAAAFLVDCVLRAMIDRAIREMVHATGPALSIDAPR